MTVKVLTFASYRELLGFDEVLMALPDPPTLGELLKHPRFAALPASALFAVNHRFADTSWIIRSDDEIALMPPVSGG